MRIKNFVLICAFATFGFVDNIHAGAEKRIENEWKTLRFLGDELVSGDVSQRSAALSALEKLDAVDLVQLGLYHPDVSFRIATAQALAHTGSASAIHYLIDVLKMNNYHVANNGGDDEVAVRIQFKRELVRAIEVITGKKFDVTDFDDVDQIASVLRNFEKN